jgi:hypothetical protein
MIFYIDVGKLPRLVADVISNNVPFSHDFIFVSNEPFQSHRTPWVQLARAYSHFRAEAITKAIGKAS